MINNKIKSLLTLKGYNFSRYAEYMGITKQSLNNKAIREAYKITDLIKLGELTNTQLAFIDENNKPVVVFDKEDLQ